MRLTLLVCGLILSSAFLSGCTDSDPLPTEPLRRMDAGLRDPIRDAAMPPDAQSNDTDAGDTDAGDTDAGDTDAS